MAPDKREICSVAGKHIPAARHRGIILIIILIIVLIMCHCSTMGFISLFSSQKQKLWQRQEQGTQRGQKGWIILGRSFFPTQPRFCRPPFPLLTLGAAEHPKKSHCSPSASLGRHSFLRGERKTLQGIPEWFGLEESLKKRSETSQSK